MTIAVAVRAIIQNVLRQHLDHSYLTRPSAGGADRVEVALLKQAQRGKYLGTKKGWTTAIMGQSCKRVQCVEVALEAPKICLKRPKRQ